jgi:lysylphosphatidylglycerol synthetase-like protein (DUF2156 family)
MSKMHKLAACIMLCLHGLIHLMGTAVYLKLGEIEGMDYKTTLLWGRWDLGQTGIGMIGVLWAVAALGFLTAALAMAAGWRWARPALLAVTLLSLVLSILDWETARAGAVLDLVILAVICVAARLPGRNAASAARS